MYPIQLKIIFLICPVPWVSFKATLRISSSQEILVFLAISPPFFLRNYFRLSPSIPAIVSFNFSRCHCITNPNNASFSGKFPQTYILLLHSPQKWAQFNDPCLHVFMSSVVHHVKRHPLKPDLNPRASKWNNPIPKPSNPMLPHPAVFPAKDSVASVSIHDLVMG